MATVSRSRGKPLVRAALGARGSGKSAWVKQLLDDAAPPRLLVWDPMREYKLPATSSFPDLCERMEAPSWQIAYQPTPGRFEVEFALVCRAVKSARRVFFVVDELAFVTKPQKAPPAWRELCLLGRHATHAECHLVGISARPASMDKDFLSVCDVIHCGRLTNPGDAKAVAPFLGCNWRDLAALPDLHYVERTAGKGEATRGVLTFAGAAKKVSHKVRKPKAAA